MHFTHFVTKGTAPEAPGLCKEWWTSTWNVYLFVATDDGRKRESDFTDRLRLFMTYWEKKQQEFMKYFQETYSYRPG